MEAQIVQRDGLQVIGVEQRLDPMTADWPALWTGFFEQQMAALAPLMAGPSVYGLYFGTDQPSVMDWVAGVAVAPGTAAPEGLVFKDAPGGQYALFECPIFEVGTTWEAIFQSWLPASTWALDGDRPCLEEYGPGSSEGTVPVQIYVSIKPKG